MNTLTTLSDETFETNVTTNTSTRKHSILFIFAIKELALLMINISFILILDDVPRKTDFPPLIYMLGAIGLCLCFYSYKVTAIENTESHNNKIFITLRVISTLLFLNGVFFLWFLFPSSDPEFFLLLAIPILFGGLLLIACIKNYTTMIKRIFAIGLYITVGIFSIEMIILFITNISRGPILNHPSNILIFSFLVFSGIMILITIINLFKETIKFNDNINGEKEGIYTPNEANSSDRLYVHGSIVQGVPLNPGNRNVFNTTYTNNSSMTYRGDYLNASNASDENFCPVHKANQ